MRADFAGLRSRPSSGGAVSRSRLTVNDMESASNPYYQTPHIQMESYASMMIPSGVSRSVRPSGYGAAPTHVGPPPMSMPVTPRDLPMHHATGYEPPQGVYPAPSAAMQPAPPAYTLGACTCSCAAPGF